MAQPPVARERRVLYTGFRLPDRTDAAALARQKLRAVREAAPRHGFAGPLARRLIAIRRIV